MKVKVAGFLDNSLVNGSGLRSVLFVSGCKHNCIGCHNKVMQNYDYGDNVHIEDIFNRIKKNIPLIKGVTFSGGEPFDSAKELNELAKMIKSEGLNIWSYTGYSYEELLNSKDEKKFELLSNIDVLIDGKYHEELKEGALKYTGSSNQRVIDVKKSNKSSKVIQISF